MTESFLVSVSTKVFLNSISTKSYLVSLSTKIYLNSISTESFLNSLSTAATSEFVATSDTFNFILYAIIPGCILFTFMITAFLLYRRHSPEENMKKSPSFSSNFSAKENEKVKKDMDERNWFMLGLFGIPSEEPIGSQIRIRKDENFNFDQSNKSLARNITQASQVEALQTKEKITFLNNLAQSKPNNPLSSSLKVRIDKDFSFNSPGMTNRKRIEDDEDIRDKIETLNRIAQSKSRERLNEPLNIRIDKDFTFDDTAETRQKIKRLNDFLHVGNDNDEGEQEDDRKTVKSSVSLNLRDGHMDLQLEDIDMA